MFTHSIRWRLQAWLAFLLVCVLSGFGVTVYQLHRLNQFNQLDEELGRRVAALNTAVRGGPPPEFDHGRPQFGGRPEHSDPDDDSAHPVPPRGRPDFPPPGRPREMRFGPRALRFSPELLSLFDETQTNGFYFAAWTRDGSLLKRSTNAPPDLALPERPGRDARTHRRMRDAFREAYYFTGLGDCVLAGRSITADLDAMRQFAWWLLAAGGAVLALGLGGGWRLTTRAIRPIEEISAAASRISAGNLSERIRGPGTNNELGRLAGVLNSTFGRLDAAFSQQRRFTADASHELRTPLAVIISETQTALARERTAEEYRETVEACLDTAQQMRRLTESLLELARLDAGQEQIQSSSQDLAQIARNCVERIRPLAAQSHIPIHCDLALAPVMGNADQLAQVVTNLLANAIHYNKPSGDIRVSSRTEDKTALLVVADTGQGIAAEDLPHIFERFYRADTSRSRAQGRSGLGLAICKAIVDAAGGSIEVKSQVGEGATFTVRFPSDPTCPSLH